MLGARARQTAAAALAAAVLMATAACGGDGAGRPAAPSPAAPAASSPAPHAAAPAGPRPLTRTQLLAVALSEDDDAGAYTADEPVDGEPPAGDMFTAEPAVCQPLVSLAKGATPYDPAAEIVRTVWDPDAERGVDVDLHLRSYTARDAAAVMRALARAGRECAHGFTEQRALTDARVLRVDTLRPPAAGDEAYAFRITTQDVEDAHLKLYDYLTVIRSGSTTLSFRADTHSTEDVGGVPQDVVDAQWHKFRRATP
ncbi:hypothetical protein AB0E88_11065 [Streptomyces sp. NPDC028635]|uniref:hypothetical protein n=1 Tax=Streptomyces sp. NPDC028635 TaxID=3154800 RepID=UPI00340BC167